MLDPADIHAACRALGEWPPTPLLQRSMLDDMCGGPVLLKLENLNITGSFKIRGASNRIAQIPQRARKAGIVAWSSGNHAQAVAYAARRAGLDATIVMPKDAPAVKIEAVKRLGAGIRFYDRDSESREEIAGALIAKTGAWAVPPYDHQDIIAGQGTAGLEITRQTRNADIYLCPVGGGGLISGTAVALKARWPHIRIIGIEPEGFDDTRRSLAAGRRVFNDRLSGSICDSLLAPAPGEHTFPIMKQYVDDLITVTDQEVRSAIRFAFTRLRVVVEPGGAVALAALLGGKIETRGQTAVVMISGGNIDSELYRDILLDDGRR